MPMCSVSGCDNKYRSIGLCSTHWKINKKYGTPTPVCWCGEFVQTNAGNRGASMLCSSHTLWQRFWSYVDICDENQCWEWIGSRTEAGYGIIWWEGKLTYAHRLSVGFDTDNMHLLQANHHCDNPPCVNPKHLYIGTQQDNMIDKVSRNRHKKAST